MTNHTNHSPHSPEQLDVIDPELRELSVDNGDIPTIKLPQQQVRDFLYKTIGGAASYGIVDMGEYGRLATSRDQISHHLNGSSLVSGVVMESGQRVAVRFRKATLISKAAAKLLGREPLAKAQIIGHPRRVERH